MHHVGVVGALCVGLSGCFGFGGDDTSGDDAPTTPGVVIAVGASVTPVLESHFCDTPRFNELCVDGQIEDITNVTVDSDAFTVGQPFELDHRMVLPITAHRAGDAHIRFELTNIIRSEAVEVLIRATEIERTEVHTYCEGSPVFDNATLAVASGVSFNFETVAMAGDRQLLTGNLEIVQAEGFTLTPPEDEGRVATAPAALGSYDWQLAGSGVKTFVVYDVAELAPTLERSGADIRVGRSVGDVAVCAHGRDERTMITVTSGTCRPATSYAEVVGPMPIGLSGRSLFELVADTAQACTVTATIESTGHAVTATFDATVPEPFTPPGGILITATPAMISDGTYGGGGDCGSSLTDGDCDGHLEFPPLPTDGDCYIDSDWSTQFLDGSTPIGNDYVGIGLATQFRMKVVANLLTLQFDVGPPQNLMLDYNTGDLQIERLGCTGVEEVLQITPLQSATILGHSLSFTASNLDDDGDMDVHARTVESVRFGTTPGTIYFEHSTIDGTPAYYNGSVQLRGIAPVTVETNGTTATRSGTSIYLGEGGSTVTLRSAGKAQTLSVVGESAISAIRGFAYNDQIEKGLQICKDVAPLNGSQEIQGVRSRPKLSLSGPALVMGDGLTGQFCLYGYAVGQSNVTLTWGNVTDTRTVVVRPDPFGN